MALNSHLQTALADAIRSYDFPCVVYDFVGGCELACNAMRDVELGIAGSLMDDDPVSVRDGLSNVLYWGYARIGYRDHRVSRFRKKVTYQQLAEAGKLFRQLEGPGLREIARLGLPEFSGMSFVSKVRMFLDPTAYVTLDQKLLKIRDEAVSTVLGEVSFSRAETRIRISGPNERAYEQWCELCRTIARRYFRATGVRAADVERGVFHLVDHGKAYVAAQVLAQA